MLALRKTISLVLAALIAMQCVPGAAGQESVASQITAVPAGTKIELVLKNKQTLRGRKGSISASGFTLVDSHKADHQIAFDDVASAKQIKPHTTRNVLILVGITVAALGIAFAVFVIRAKPILP